MTNEILIALIAAGSAIFSSVIAASIAIFLSNKRNVEYNTRKKLIQAYKDIIAFHQLEQMYTDSLSKFSSPIMTQMSVKRAYRKELRELGNDSPSSHSSELICKTELDKLKI